MKRLLFISFVCALSLSPAIAGAFDLEESIKQLQPQYEQHRAADFSVAQRGCTSLAQAIEQVRRRGDVERILSADTKREGGREVHHIRYLTKDGRVRTKKVRGC